MTKPRVYQPERRFAQKANAPGGITIAEALQRADRNVAAGRERYLGAVDAKLKIAVEQAKAEDTARLVELRSTASEVADLAGVYDLDELCAAATSLRHLLSTLIVVGGDPPWAAIRVHMDAMVSLRRPDISGNSQARAAVIEGLRQVVMRHGGEAG